MTSKAKKILVFANGITAVFNEEGEQMFKQQGSCVNYKYITRLAKLAADNNVEIEYQEGNLYDWRDELKKHIEINKKITT